MKGKWNPSQEWKVNKTGKAIIDYELDDDGVINLMEAILIRAHDDYMNELPIGGTLTTEQRRIESFIRRCYGDKADGVISKLRHQHPRLN